ncbi:uncharacterized protein FFNC_15405 [Fusarium fujikuroi]|nr:uncharacterized protein FFNC_15405 [Fusarium fujikuroi]
MVSIGGKALRTIPLLDLYRAAFKSHIQNIEESQWQQLVTIADGLSNEETAGEEVLDFLRNSAGVEDYEGLSHLSTVDIQVIIHSVKFQRGGGS